jgi:hypothetical protein
VDDVTLSAAAAAAFLLAADPVAAPDLIDAPAVRGSLGGSFFLERFPAALSFPGHDGDLLSYISM